MEYTKPRRGSRCHSFLFLLAAVLGLACGRCGAELVIAMINVFYGQNVIDEDSLVTERWMAGVAFAVGGVMLAAMFLEDRHEHQSGRLADRLRAISDGQLVFKTPKQTRFIELDAERDGELMQLAKRCAQLWQVVGASHLLKGDAVILERGLNRDLGRFVLQAGSDQGLLQALSGRLRVLHRDLVRLDNYLKVESAIAVPAQRGRLCYRRHPRLLLGQTVERTDAAVRGQRDVPLLRHGMGSPV